MHRAWLLHLAKCRKDPVLFVEYVFQIELAPVQVDWIRMWQHCPKSVLHGAVGLGKSMLARGFILWLIGNNMTEQVIWLGATQRQPKKSLRMIANLIEAKGHKSRLHHVFPDLKPGGVWRSTEVEVVRDIDPLDADPTIGTFGAYSDSILGSRATTLVIDDLCNFTNTLTQDSREKMIEWMGSVYGRLTREDVRILVLGNYWHEQDATCVFARKSGVKYKLTPAYTEDEQTGEKTLTAPTALGWKRIHELEDELGPVQAERMLRCRAVSSELGRFRRAWFAAALDAGRGRPFRPQYVAGACYTGVDLGHTAKVGSDLTVIVTATVLTDGKKQIVDIRSGRWTSPEILRQLTEVRIRYGSIIGVESNGGQKLFIDLGSDITAIPMVDNYTGVNKYHYATGVENLANELSQGHWVFPCPNAPKLDLDAGMVDQDDGEDEVAGSRWTLNTDGGQPDKEIQALISEALVYDPEKRKHTGDRLMAWWICAETIRKSVLGAMIGVQSALDVPTYDLFSR